MSVGNLDIAQVGAIIHTWGQIHDFVAGEITLYMKSRV